MPISLLHGHHKEGKGVPTLPSLIWSEAKCADQAETRTFPVLPDSPALSRKPKLLDEPIAKSKLFDKQTPEHQEYANHHHPLPLLPPLNKEGRRHHCPAEQGKILQARNFQEVAHSSHEKFRRIYRGKRSPDVNHSEA